MKTSLSPSHIYVYKYKIQIQIQIGDTNGDEDLAETALKSASEMVKACPQLALLHVQRCCHNFQRLHREGVEKII